MIDNKKKRIEGDVKITSFYGFTVYEYFELTEAHGKIFVIEMCYNYRPSQVHEDEHGTRIRKTCVTKDTLEKMSTIEYKKPVGVN